MNTQDFNAHIQKPEHKAKEISLKPISRNGHEYHLMGMSSILENGANCENGGEKIEPESVFSQQFVVNGAKMIDGNRASGINLRSPSIPADAINWGNSIIVEQILQVTTANIINITSRTTQRISNEHKIVERLTNYLDEIDSALRIVPFGSATYGFGGANTDFNILIDSSKKNMLHFFMNKPLLNLDSSLDTGDSTEDPKLALHLLRKYFQMPNVLNDFDVLASMDGDRVQKKRLQAIHKMSGIRCFIESDSSLEICETSQMIRDCIALAPVCK